MLYHEVVSDILSEIYVAWDVLFSIFLFERSLDVLSVFGGASLSLHLHLISGGTLNLGVCRVEILEVLSVVETVSTTSTDHERVVTWRVRLVDFELGSLVFLGLEHTVV